MITGWSAGPKADALRGKTPSEILTTAMRSLERIVHAPLARLENAWFHDWQADPFARGAYSYVPAGALAARRTLAEPVDDTLDFADEATDLVKAMAAQSTGAIASGKRAAAHPGRAVAGTRSLFQPKPHSPSPRFTRPNSTRPWRSTSEDCKPTHGSGLKYLFAGSPQRLNCTSGVAGKRSAWWLMISFRPAGFCAGGAKGRQSVSAQRNRGADVEIGKFDGRGETARPTPAGGNPSAVFKYSTVQGVSSIIAPAWEPSTNGARNVM